MAMIATFAALAEPSRFRIFELLRGGARPVGEIVSELALQQPQVSKHLAVLKGAGLVDVEARAQNRLYRLRAEPIRAMHEWLEDYRQLWDERFAGLDAVLASLQPKRPPGGARGRKPRKRIGT